MNTRGREDAERLTADVIEQARHYGRYGYRKGGCLADRIDRRDYLGVMMILDCGVRPENLAVTSMMLGVPVPDAPLELAEKSKPRSSAK